MSSGPFYVGLKLRTIGHKLKPSTAIKVRQPEKRAEGFYLSPEWRSFMEALIVERFGAKANTRCEDRDCRQPHRRGIRIFGDHIKERKDGGAPFDKRNVLCRCGSCHTRKTAAERSKRMHTPGGG